MPTYIALIKLTDKGAKEIKHLPERVRAAGKMIEKMGGKLKEFYLTIGEYDCIAVAETPNDEVACTFLLGLDLEGSVRTSTVKAFDLEEFTQIVKNLP